MALSSRRPGQVVLTALWLVACQAAAPAGDIAGLYRHEGPVAATLEVRQQGAQYVVRLEGGGAPTAGAATPADCVLEARGDLDGATLRARFGPVETDTFSYGAEQAAREGRTVEVVFEPGAAEVVEAATMGYCGWAPSSRAGTARPLSKRAKIAARWLPSPPNNHAIALGGDQIELAAGGTAFTPCIASGDAHFII